MLFQISKSCLFINLKFIVDFFVIQCRMRSIIIDNIPAEALSHG